MLPDELPKLVESVRNGWIASAQAIAVVVRPLDVPSSGGKNLVLTKD